MTRESQFRPSDASTLGISPGSSRFTTAKRVARNALWLLLSQGSARIIGFVTGTVLARAFGATDFGTYTFVLTYVSYFGYLADAGLGRYLIRNVARERQRAADYLASITGLRLVLAAVAYTLMLAILFATRSPADRTALVAVAGVSLFTGAVAGAVASVFNAREEMHITALFGVLSSGATAVFVFAALMAGAGLPGTIVAVSVANLPPLGYLLVMWQRRRPEGLVPGLLPQPRASRAMWLEALRKSYPYALLGLLGLVYFRIDALMLTWLVGTEATGIYTAAYRLLDAVTDAPGVIVAAMFPALARLHLGPRAQLRRAYATVLPLLIILGLPVMLALLLFSDEITRLLYGSGYAESATVLRLLSVAVFLIFADTANTMLLYSGDDLWTVLRLSLVTTVANVLLNLLLIPRYSYNGAAVATIASTALSLMIFTPTVLRYLRTEPEPRDRGTREGGARPASSF